MTRIENNEIRGYHPYTFIDNKMFEDFLQQNSITLSNEIKAECCGNDGKYFLTFVEEVVNSLGYFIDVTEVAAPSSFGDMDSRWKRTGQYRWQITQWNRDNEIARLIYSDNNNDMHFFDSFPKAKNDALMKIISGK